MKVCWFVLDNSHMARLQSTDTKFEHRSVEAWVLGTLPWTQLGTRESTQDHQGGPCRRQTVGLTFADTIRLSQILEVANALFCALLRMGGQI